MTPLDIEIVRDVFGKPANGAEGFALGKIYVSGVYFGETLEDEDRRLESGGTKIYGKTAMPIGRYKIELYHSPKHGEVPLFKEVPQFSMTEIHRANRAEELLGCVGVGRVRIRTGVADCQIVLDRIVQAMQAAEDEGRDVYCTISRAGE